MKFPNKKYFSCRDFYIDYNNKLSQTFKDNHFDELVKITKFLEKKIRAKNQIFVCGNGGSASIANHFLCDFNKGIKLSSKYKMIPKVYSLTNSIELITAISNDIKYENIFDFQLENYANKGDVIFAFSCSGNSKNILNLMKKANSMKLDIIFISGFLKKKLNTKVKFHYDLSCQNYGVTEDMFSSFMHLISQWIRFKYSNYSKNQIL